MQEYLQKTHLSTIMDEIGVLLALMTGSMGLFLLLWGLRLSAVIAGGASFILCVLLRARTRERRLRRREDKLRRRIGGELAVEGWVTCDPCRAHLEAARLLSEPLGLTVERVTASGALCRAGEGQRVGVACAQLHRADKLNARDVAAFQRFCQRLRADRGVLCGAGATAEATEQAAAFPEVLLVGRDRMIALAGAAHPATDRQLVELGRRSAVRRDRKALTRAMLESSRAEKYLLYGLMLLGLYLLAGQAVYLLTGLICLGLMVACRIAQGRERGRSTHFFLGEKS